MSAYDNDTRVMKTDEGYSITRDDGTNLMVLPRETGGGDWAVYFPSSTFADRRPYFGMAGSASDCAERAIEWALR